jgi:non-ribosomal peptide synthetase component F
VVGGTVHILPDEVSHDPVLLLQEVENRHISILETVPALLRLIVEETANRGSKRPSLAALRWLILTGEALPADFCQRWFSIYPHIPLLNAYGPTECSDDVTHYALTKLETYAEPYLPIGKPVANTEIYLLDDHFNPVPVNVAGQIYVGGVGVGRGYLNEAGKTAQVFIPHPFSQEPGARLYRTGDLARYHDDGTIAFLTRVDHQVKIRGFRIELG